ncbi:MAG TPA: hypothetical protein VJ692_00100 [Nitrospiraceae bacterium]|nr:hypothetical protein [Nitrospiraceae bacterium]
MYVLIMWQRLLRLFWLIMLMAGLVPIPNAFADDDPPLTRNVPIEEFQNRNEDVKPYNFDAPPEGIFRSISLAEGFDEEMGVRRTHEIVPISITNVFNPDAPSVFIVFTFYQHLDSFQVSALCYPEEVHGLSTDTLVTQDTMYVALEDDSGYLRLDAPQGGWKPGRYKAEIHVGWKINEISLIGTMRFTVRAEQSTLQPSVSIP